MRNLMRPLAVLSVAALAAGVLAACGDDDDDVAANGNGDAPRSDVSDEFCQARVDVEAAFNEEDLAAAEAALTQLEESAPESLSDDVTTVAEALADDPEAAFEDEDVVAAVAAIDEVVLDDCGFAVVEVTAGDYEFTGIPATLDAGTTAFQLTNEGNEFHEIAVAVVPEDLDEPVLDLVDRAHELFEAGEEEAAEELLEFAAFVFVPPGETDVGIAELEPGEYIALCFIPVGTQSEADFETADGPPHFHEGMYFEFTVS